MRAHSFSIGGGALGLQKNTPAIAASPLKSAILLFKQHFYRRRLTLAGKNRSGTAAENRRLWAKRPRDLAT